MSLAPVILPAADDELSRLVESYCDGEITDEGRDRLESLLAGDRDAKLFLIAYLDLHAQMQWLTRGDSKETGNPLVTTPPLPTTHHPLPTNFVGGPVFSYMVATVVLCLMLLGAWAYKISHVPSGDSQFARHNRNTGPSTPIFVGRITGMKDCRWSDPNTETYIGASAALGREYALSSGLMEITYASGARVILEGPCAYRVESSDGGFLERGKLTARIVHQGAAASADGTKPQAIFFVKTPTAIITDLGTEFGVVVDKNGDTTSHVFQGSVKIQVFDAGYIQSVVLRENESAKVEEKSIRVGAAYGSKEFVRELNVAKDSSAEKAYIDTVLSDKPLAYWPLNEPAYAHRFSDRSGNGFHGVLIGNGTAGAAGPLSDGSRAVALNGHGYIDAGRHNRFTPPNDFTIEAWVWIDDSTTGLARIISVDTGRFMSSITDRRSGWGLAYTKDADPRWPDDAASFFFTKYWLKNTPLTDVHPPSKQWMHIVVTFDQNNTVDFFLNGKRLVSISSDEPATVQSAWVILGARASSDQYWYGRLAHVAVYPHVLKGNRIKAHYQLASPTAQEEKTISSQKKHDRFLYRGENKK